MGDALAGRRVVLLAVSGFTLGHRLNQTTTRCYAADQSSLQTSRAQEVGDYL